MGGPDQRSGPPGLPAWLPLADALRSRKANTLDSGQSGETGRSPRHMGTTRGSDTNL